MNMTPQNPSLEKDVFPLKPAFHFSHHEADEFRIQDEEKIQGIFKIWPVDVLSILEGEKMQRNHLTRMILMRKWLTVVALSDRRLQESFAGSHQTEIDITTRGGELFAQMEGAFFVFEPFYCIEATVDDKRENLNLDEGGSGGEIDLVALMLPGIFGKIVQNCETWEDIERTIESLRESFRQDIHSADGQKFILLALLSRKLGISFAESLFASKILTLIHKKSEGSSEDVTTCREILQRSYRRNSSLGSQKTIDADINAKIRFMNWLPIKKTREAFQGQWMNYDAVCNTASKLFEIVSENPNLIIESRQAWFRKVQPQLMKLDASSARGRFLLQMFLDNCFSQEFVNAIKRSREKVWNYIEKKDKEDLFSLGKDTTHVDLAQVGGKGLGIALAREVFGAEMTIKTSCIPWTWVQEWLMGIPGFPELLIELEQAKNIEEKIVLGERMRERIGVSTIPLSLLEKFKNMDDMLIFRSSALTEDTEDIGSAPGIFESHKVKNTQEDTSLALKRVIASFFSDRAIVFREEKGLCHTPLISVLVQPFIEGIHGSVFVTEEGVQIDISSSNVNTLDAGTTSFHFELDRREFENTIQQEIFRISLDAFRIFGPIDIELIIQDSRITLLQLRMLNHGETSVQKKDITTLTPRDIHISSVDAMKQLDVAGDEQLHIHFDRGIDFNKFQEELSLHIIRQSRQIHSISLPIFIAPTCHFSNIIRTLGIRLHLPR